MDDTGRHVLVSGCSRGLGLELVEHYLARGRHVIGCSRTPAKVTAGTGTRRFLHYQVDICDERAVVEMMSSIRREVGGFGMLINNAGIASAQSAILAKSSLLHEVLSTNVVGNYVVTRESLKMMRFAGYGRVVNISSIAVPIEEMGNSFYAASKQALTRITHQMVRELKGANITVNTIGISFVEQGTMFQRLSQDSADRYRKRLTDPSPISIEEIAHAIDFFEGDTNGRITGQTVYFGGPY